ncbi:hypothetical protein L1049_011823 [Liquidambar formosana]|uniref:Protein gar2 n=1 Tax=Liquidambar formosana TaxID=63359 RepID=A0AAP0RS57_LIQFO
MVLSNKKLKQKLRAAVAESLAESVAETHPSNNDSANPDPNPNPQSLKQLLDSATQKPRLSKREKRRKTLSLDDSEAVNKSSDGINFEENNEADTGGVNHNNNDEKEKKKKKKKKRKRDEDRDELLENEDEVKAKKNKRKRNGDGDGDGNADGNGGEVLENGDEVLENGDEVKKAKKKKKKKKKNKKKKNVNNIEENKDSEVGNAGSGEQGVAETVKISDSQENVEVATKVYVGGIPYYSTEDDIRSYFEGCGTITEVDCMRFPESGKFRGIAIISFKTEAAAKRALALDGADMGGLFLKIQPYKTTRANKASPFVPEIVEGYNRIYVGNLSWDITEDDLRKFFSDCSISSIRFGMDKETGEFRGYAHVDFSDNLSLTMALKLDQEIACGRPVKISCAVPMKGAKTDSSLPTSENADGAGMSSGSGKKKKRRTCYECGQPGHLSSACPRKQAVDPTNSSAS